MPDPQAVAPSRAGRPALPSWATVAAWCALFGALVALEPGRVPRIWYDEGWVLSLARNWAERGHYGHLLLGEPVPAGLPATGLPAVAPVALSFRLFGVGLWQARLPGIVLTLAAVATLCALAGRLYGRPAALTTLSAALLLNPHPVWHPVLAGRQALGDMPALLLLLLGFLIFLNAWKRPGWCLPLAILSWALALRTKTQIFPFFAAALAVPLALAVWQRRWRSAGLLGAGLTGTLVAAALLAWGQARLLASTLFSPASGHELYGWLGDPSTLTTYLAVPDLRVHLGALLGVLFLGWPTLLGLGAAAYTAASQRRRPDLDTGRDVVRLALWTLTACWLGWYVLLSIGFARWFFPAAFVGSLFVAALLQDIAGGLHLTRLLRRGAGVLHTRRLTLRSAGILLLAVGIPAMALLTLFMLFQAYTAFADRSLEEVTGWLNAHAAPGAVVETADAEIIFLLDRPVHFPPAEVEAQLNRRTFLRDGTPVDYDPLAAWPDYVVVGNQGRLWGVYDALLLGDRFRLAYEVGGYQVYARAGP